ncbi:MAG: AAA family ATPase [Clostridium sp.]
MEKKKQDKEKPSILELVSNFLSKMRLISRDEEPSNKAVDGKDEEDTLSSDMQWEENINIDKLRSIGNAILDSYKIRLADQFNIKLRYDDGVMMYILDSFDSRRGRDGLETVIEDKIYSPIIDLKLREKINSNNIVSIAVMEGLLVATSGMDEIVLDNPMRGSSISSEVDITDELSRIVGLTNIKDFITTIEDILKIQSMNQNQGIEEKVSLNMIFQGNPGTGKRTIADLLSRYLGHLGYLTSSNIVEVYSDALIGENIFDTRSKTQDIINKSSGGALLITDAYNIGMVEDKNIGNEIINQLVRAMDEDNRIIILTGTGPKMDEFLTNNIAILSKIKYNLQFTDYTSCELMEMLRIKLNERGFVLVSGGERAILDYIVEMAPKLVDSNGNGMLIDNLIGHAILNYETRTRDNVLMGLNNTLVVEDFKLV